MTPDDRLTEVFERGLKEGFDCLTPTDRELYLIQEFILDQDMGGLSGYFYNHLPNIAYVEGTVDAMRRHGLSPLAELLSQALALFSGYVEPERPTTWAEVLKMYDPSNRLDVIEKCIWALDNYGLPKSAIQ